MTNCSCSFIYKLTLATVARSWGCVGELKRGKAPGSAHKQHIVYIEISPQAVTGNQESQASSHFLSYVTVTICLYKHTTGLVCEMPARKMRSAMKRQMQRCRWMVVRVPCMERQNLNVRMHSMRHSREMISPILVITWSPKVC